MEKNPFRREYSKPQTWDQPFNKGFQSHSKTYGPIIPYATIKPNSTKSLYPTKSTKSKPDEC